MTSKTTIRTSVYTICSCSLIALATNATAQQAGTYKGTTKDGNAVTIVVAVDPNNQKLEVSGAGFNFTLHCVKTQETLYSGWGIGFANGQDIVNGKFSYAFDFPEQYLPMSMTFHGKTKVSGKVGLDEAAFNPATNYTAKPTKLQFCDSNQPFTATYSGADTHTAPPGTVTIKGPNYQTIQNFPGKEN